MKTIKERQHQIKKDEIVKVAEKLFRENGVEGTTINDIAKVTGYTHRSMYNFFEGKADLLLLVYIKGLRKRKRIVSRELKKKKPPLETLRSIAKEWHKFYLTNPLYTQLHIYMDTRNVIFSDSSRELFEKENSGGWEVFFGLFDTAIREGQIIGHQDARALATQFIYTIRAITKHCSNPAHDFIMEDTDRYFESYLELFFRGIAK